MNFFLHKKNEVFLLGLLLVVLAYFPLFQFLGSLPYRLWDESRQAYNAFEMYSKERYLVPHFEGMPDMWNTKPPLLIWLQVIFFNLFGISETSLRLPSALAGLATCLLVFFFFARYLKKPLIGFLAAIILISTQGFIDFHSTRTGDYDALLTFFDTAALLSFFVYVQDERKKFLFYTFITLTLGCLTKGVAGLMFTPVLVLAAVYKGKIRPILLSREFYFGLLIFLFIVFGYYAGRESVNPGYLKAVWNNEIVGRYLATVENHHQPFWYYFENMLNIQLGYLFYLIPGGILVMFMSERSKQKEFLMYAFTALIFFFLIISSGQTKLFWYNVPLFPLTAILIAAFIDYLCELTYKLEAGSRLNQPILSLFLIFILIVPAYSANVSKTYKPVDVKESFMYEPGKFLQSVYKDKIKLNAPLQVYYNGHPYHLTIYCRMLTAQKKDVEVILEDSLVKRGNWVLVSQEETENKLTQHHSVRLIQKEKGNSLYQVE